MKLKPLSTALLITSLVSGCNTTNTGGLGNILNSAISAVTGGESTDKTAPKEAVENTGTPKCATAASQRALSFTEQLKRKAAEAAMGKALKAATGSESVYKSDIEVLDTCTAEQVLSQSQKSLKNLDDVQSQITTDLEKLGMSQEDAAIINAKIAGIATESDGDKDPSVKAGELVQKLEDSAVDKRAAAAAISKGMIGSAYRVAEASQGVGKVLSFSKDVPWWMIENAASLKAAGAVVGKTAKSAGHMYSVGKALLQAVGFSNAEIEKTEKSAEDQLVIETDDF